MKWKLLINLLINLFMDSVMVKNNMSIHNTQKTSDKWRIVYDSVIISCKEKYNKAVSIMFVLEIPSYPLSVTCLVCVCCWWHSDTVVSPIHIIIS